MFSTAPDVYYSKTPLMHCHSCQRMLLCRNKKHLNVLAQHPGQLDRRGCSMRFFACSLNDAVGITVFCLPC